MLLKMRVHIGVKPVIHFFLFTLLSLYFFGFTAMKHIQIKYQLNYDAKNKYAKGSLKIPKINKN